MKLLSSRRTDAYMGCRRHGLTTYVRALLRLELVQTASCPQSLARVSDAVSKTANATSTRQGSIALRSLDTQ